MTSDSRSSILRILTAAVMPMLLCGSGCKGRGSENPDANTLLVAGDSALTLRDVVARIPTGLPEADSAALFDRIVEDWIEGMVLTELAKEKLSDFSEIERRVNHYRNRLIVSEYLSRVSRSKSSTPPADSIRAFYEAHRKEMLAERPLVKGLFLKISSQMPGLSQIRSFMERADDKSIDELERIYASDAIQYEYFATTWIDWQSIAEQIPYRFYDADAFVASTRDFETEADGMVYLLHISDYLPSGSELPFEFAAPRIESMLEQRSIGNYERRLIDHLVRKAVEEGDLRGIGYDPLTRRIRQDGVKPEKKKEKDEK